MSKDLLQEDDDTYVRPLFNDELGHVEAVAGDFSYRDGRLYKKTNQASDKIINASLPKAEWYELVELVQSPADPNEIWLAISGRELHYSLDAGKTFTKVEDVVCPVQINFVPVLDSEKHYSIFVFGTFKNGRSGGFTSKDMGVTWKPYEPDEFLPFA